MKIELLYPEIASLYGERGNITLLKQSLPEATFIETDIFDTPHFLSEAVDLVYLGPMSEKAQRLIIEKLRPHRTRILELIEQGSHFLITGNAMDIFGTSIFYEDVKEVAALDIFPFTSKLDMLHRFNCLIMGEFEGMTLVGHKTQFSMSYGELEDQRFFKVMRGVGMNPQSKNEGIFYKNFIATQMIGPMLVLNPEFTQWLLFRVTERLVDLPHKEAMLQAYHQRVSDFTSVKEDIYE